MPNERADTTRRRLAATAVALMVVLGTAAAVRPPSQAAADGQDGTGVTTFTSLKAKEHRRTTDAHQPPALENPGHRSNSEGDPVTFAVRGPDPDVATFTWSATGLPPGLSINAATGVISGQLTYDSSGVHSVTVRISDTGDPVRSYEVSFSWGVTNLNRSPNISSPGDQSGARGEQIRLAIVGSDPDADPLTWTATGLPNGVSISSVGGVIAGKPNTAGMFTVTITAKDRGTPPLLDEITFTWTVEPPPGFPNIGAIANQESATGDSIRLDPDGRHPEGLVLTWAATGLPPGISIDTPTGTISGIPTKSGSYATIVTLSDTAGRLVAAAFKWDVQDLDQPPVAIDDTFRAYVDDVADGIAVDVVDNDSDPEGALLTLRSLGAPEFGDATIVNGLVLYRPPAGWLGTVSFPYTVTDDAGNEATGTLTITIEDSLATRLATDALQWFPAAPLFLSLGRIEIPIETGTEVVLATAFQSFYLLRLPLTLLGGAVFSSLLLGGVLNLGFALRSGIPTIVRRTSRNVAVVMVKHGAKLEVLSKPGGGEAVWWFLATDRGLKSTGRRTRASDGEWTEVETPNGHGWVPTLNLTEEVDRGGFADDPTPMYLIHDLVTRMRVRHDISDLASEHGLFITHHGPVHRYRAAELSAIMDDLTVHTWRGRSPAYPDLRGTFDQAVATSFLDAWDHPHREFLHDAPAVPSTVIPVEFTNFHSISIGADVHGPERLDLPAWLVVFTYEGGRPRIVGLVKEG